MKLKYVTVHKKVDEQQAKVAKSEIFPLGAGYSSTTLGGQNFARNRSISYGF